MKSFKRLLAIHVLLFCLEISIAAKSSLRNTLDEENNVDNTHRLGENLDAKGEHYSTNHRNMRLPNGHNIFSPENNDSNMETEPQYKEESFDNSKGLCPICSETGKECRGTCITTGNPANRGCFECIGEILMDFGTPSRRGYYVVKSVDEEFLDNNNVYEMLKSGDVYLIFDAADITIDNTTGEIDSSCPPGLSWQYADYYKCEAKTCEIDPSFPTSPNSVAPTTPPPKSSPPVDSPSVAPTLEPTISKTIFPTFQLTIVDWIYPSSLLSSPVPSISATHKPSLVSSVSPTMLKPQKPSSVPTSLPTMLKPHKPSLVSSASPTMLKPQKPSSVPTSLPTISATHKPSLVSSPVPLISATHKPSLVSSPVPSSASTHKPSSTPTHVPSRRPTFPPVDPSKCARRSSKRRRCKRKVGCAFNTFTRTCIIAPTTAECTSFSKKKKCKKSGCKFDKKTGQCSGFYD